MSSPIQHQRDSVRDEYLRHLRSHAQVFVACWTMLSASDCSQEQLTTLYHQAHTIAGSAVTFGTGRDAHVASFLSSSRSGAPQ